MAKKRRVTIDNGYAEARIRWIEPTLTFTRNWKDGAPEVSAVITFNTPWEVRDTIGELQRILDYWKQEADRG